MDNTEFLKAVIVGIVAGVFSAGTIYGILKTELKFLRRDVDKLIKYVWPDRRIDDRKI